MPQGARFWGPGRGGGWSPSWGGDDGEWAPVRGVGGVAPEPRRRDIFDGTLAPKSGLKSIFGLFGFVAAFL